MSDNQSNIFGGDQSRRFPSNRQPAFTIENVFADPSVSNWLKDVLRSALQRDCVDAAHDATLLARLLGQRADNILGREIGRN